MVQPFFFAASFLFVNTTAAAPSDINEQS